jgi:hypothetical protein
MKKRTKQFMTSLVLTLAVLAGSLSVSAPTVGASPTSCVIRCRLNYSACLTSGNSKSACQALLAKCLVKC